MCKTPWLRSLVFFQLIGVDLHLWIKQRVKISWMPSLTTCVNTYAPEKCIWPWERPCPERFMVPIVTFCIHPRHLLICLDRFTIPTVSQSQHLYWFRQPRVFRRLTRLLSYRVIVRSDQSFIRILIPVMIWPNFYFTNLRSHASSVALFKGDILPNVIVLCVYISCLCYITHIYLGLDVRQPAGAPIISAIGLSMFPVMSTLCLLDQFTTYGTGSVRLLCETSNLVCYNKPRLWAVLFPNWAPYKIGMIEFTPRLYLKAFLCIHKFKQCLRTLHSTSVDMILRLSN